MNNNTDDNISQRRRQAVTPWPENLIIACIAVFITPAHRPIWFILYLIIFACVIPVFFVSPELFSISEDDWPKIIQYACFSLISLFAIFSSVNWWPEVYHRYPQSRFKTLPYPTLFLLIGIAGTFFGIYLGLEGLDLDRVGGIDPSSLNKLVAGLTTSFTTSVAGILTTLLYRILIVVFSPAQEPEGAAEIIQSIDSLAGKLDTFIDDLSEKVVQGLTESLQSLVTNLEKIVTDQLGQAFKDLNNSIVKLNEWVDRYRYQLDELTKAYEANRIGIETFVVKAEQIVNSLEPLQNYMQGIDETLEKVNKPLEEFTQLGTQARDVFPLIKENLENLTNGFTKLGDDFTKIKTDLDNAVQEMNRLGKQLSDNTQNLEDHITEKTKGHLEAFAQKLASISEQFSKDYIPITEALRKMLSDFNTRNMDDDGA